MSSGNLIKGAGATVFIMEWTKNLEIIKVVFKIIFWAFLSNFRLIPIMNHYCGSSQYIYNHIY